jgi:hypothetical protein
MRGFFTTCHLLQHCCAYHSSERSLTWWTGVKPFLSGVSTLAPRAARTWIHSSFLDEKWKKLDSLWNKFTFLMWTRMEGFFDRPKWHELHCWKSDKKCNKKVKTTFGGSRNPVNHLHVMQNYTPAQNSPALCCNVNRRGSVVCSLIKFKQDHKKVVRYKSTSRQKSQD